MRRRSIHSCRISDTHLLAKNAAHVGDRSEHTPSNNCRYLRSLWTVKPTYFDRLLLDFTRLLSNTFFRVHVNWFENEQDRWLKYHKFLHVNSTTSHETKCIYRYLLGIVSHKRFRCTQLRVYMQCVLERSETKWWRTAAKSFFGSIQDHHLEISAVGDTQCVQETRKICYV